MNSLQHATFYPEPLEESPMERPEGSGERGRAPTDGVVPLQAWRAWAECGDGSSVHLILDPRAMLVWLLLADDGLIDPRSIE